MAPVIFPVLARSELSNLPLTCTQIIDATAFVDSYYYSVIFQHFDYSSCALLHAFQFFLTTPWGPNLNALLQDWTHQSFKLLLKCIDEFSYLLNHNFISGRNRNDLANTIPERGHIWIIKNYIFILFVTRCTATMSTVLLVTSV